MGQSRSRYSLSRIDPFSLAAIIPALALAGLCGVSGFVPGAIAMAVLAVAIVALEVWIHRRDPDAPATRRAPAQSRQAQPRQTGAQPRQPGAQGAQPRRPQQQQAQQRARQPQGGGQPVRRQPPPPPRRTPPPPQARQPQGQPPQRPRMR